MSMCFESDEKSTFLGMFMSFGHELGAVMKFS